MAVWTKKNIHAGFNEKTRMVDFYWDNCRSIYRFFMDTMVLYWNLSKLVFLFLKTTGKVAQRKNRSVVNFAVFRASRGVFLERPFLETPSWPQWKCYLP